MSLHLLSRILKHSLLNQGLNFRATIHKTTAYLKTVETNPVDFTDQPLLLEHVYNMTNVWLVG